MTPQARTIARHLRDVGSISNVEAHAIYKCRSVSRRITEIMREDKTLTITKERKVDHTGQRYVRYNAKPVPVKGAPKLGDRVRVTTLDPYSGNREYFAIGSEGVVCEDIEGDSCIRIAFDKGYYNRSCGGKWWNERDCVEVVARAA